ncbi:hypothetical protein PR048_025366 [Dryococelus australis]|uniref:Uncharacterized protein n=1 Tax=Dryococelus australis TaxID=614101 RepID=A0ABQ9GR82_9NEOP|nr:hypothetical protein PR048_025366 [Dryococelus australis]
MKSSVMTKQAVKNGSGDEVQWRPRRGVAFSAKSAVTEGKIAAKNEILTDFNVLHPDKEMNLYSRWPELSKRVLELANERSKDPATREWVSSLTPDSSKELQWAVVGVMAKFARLPPRRSRFHSKWSQSWIFTLWESCRTVSLAGGFSRGTPVSPAFVFWCCSMPTSSHLSYLFMAELRQVLLFRGLVLAGCYHLLNDQNRPDWLMEGHEVYYNREFHNNGSLLNGLWDRLVRGVLYATMAGGDADGGFSIAMICSGILTGPAGIDSANRCGGTLGSAGVWRRL